MNKKKTREKRERRQKEKWIFNVCFFFSRECQRETIDVSTVTSDQEEDLVSYIDVSGRLFAGSLLRHILLNRTCMRTHIIRCKRPSRSSRSFTVLYPRRRACYSKRTRHIPHAAVTSMMLKLKQSENQNETKVTAAQQYKLLWWTASCSHLLLVTSY